MAKWLGFDKQPMPAIGDAFLVPIRGGHVTFAWVVRLYEARKVYGGKKLGDYILHDLVIACAAWTGRDAPPASELRAPAVREAFDLFADEPRPLGSLVMVASSPPPKRWRALGKVTPAATDAPLLIAGTLTLPDGSTRPSPSYGGFEGLQRNAQRAWQLLGDRAGLLAAERAEAKADAARERVEARADAARVAARRRATLAQLATIDLLPEWDGLVDRRSSVMVAKHLRACVAALRALQGPTRKDKLAVIEATVARLNAWNDRTGLIDTPEREALSAALDDIGRAAGLRGRDFAGPFRDW